MFNLFKAIFSGELARQHNPHLSKDVMGKVPERAAPTQTLTALARRDVSRGSPPSCFAGLTLNGFAP